MSFIKSVITLFVVIFCAVFFNRITNAQDNTQTPTVPSINTTPTTTGVLDSKLNGEWISDSRDANFSKIQFGADGSFVGYTLAADSKPFATGTYQILNGSIIISATVGSSTMDGVSATYTYKNYSVTDKQLQITLSDRNVSIAYSKSKS